MKRLRGERGLSQVLLFPLPLLGLTPIELGVGKRNKAKLFARPVIEHQWWRGKSCIVQVRFGPIQWWTQHNLWGPVQNKIKKDRKKVLLKILNYKTFFFLYGPSLSLFLSFSLSLSTCHRAFNFLFNFMVLRAGGYSQGKCRFSQMPKAMHMIHHVFGSISCKSLDPCPMSWLGMGKSISPSHGPSAPTHGRWVTLRDCNRQEEMYLSKHPPNVPRYLPTQDRGCCRERALHSDPPCCIWASTRGKGQQ